MIRIMPVMFLFLMSCASCQTVKDPAESPSSMDQDRIVMRLNETIEVGIGGLIDLNKTVMIRSYGAGTVTIRGLEDCGYITSGATKKTGWIQVNPLTLPNKEFCLYSLQARTNGFDAPVIGHLLVRRFMDPNVRPLKITMNNVMRDGVNWVQLMKDGPKNLFASNGPFQVPYGIFENRDIDIFLGAHRGKLNITGCGMTDVIEYQNQPTMRLTVDYLYRSIGKIEQSCVFTLTANHDDAIKESATIFIKVYSSPGSFLDAPVAEIGSEACFSFVDPYVVGIAINGDYSKSRSMCVDKAANYEVEGVTSKNRIFWGLHSGSEWVVTK